MRKFVLALPLCTIITAGLFGCGVNDDGGDRNQAANPAGYYSTEKDDLVSRINYQAPVPHMYKDMSAVERRQEAIERRGGNPTVPLSNYGNGYFYQDSDYSTKDANYHGHLSKPQTAHSSYYTAYEGRLVDKIRTRANDVNHVNDSRAVVYKGDVLVTTLLDDYNDHQAVRDAIEKKVRPLTGNLKLHVTTDQGVYYRSIALDNSLRAGGPKDIFNLDAADMFKNIGIHENHSQ
ncbi:YhcN/YlaJ family sporulation lipoprotein [Peribacillus cavernae]|uniref:YhcN/YlaJ family sporulation lipoprotein n=1 Tax=Peribacillus cavernae TaxID=1674310 RepID=UPI00163C5401|nr:YhcN/YlaJ family sporulation lipoprotein [Peribacillus cavernae]MDQ0219350.1 spore cortex protein [Peribacillus cavernae]